MAANYSFEKGKYGGQCGMIFPFFRSLSAILPIDPEYKEYIPAGFLKCRGQILNADQYPNLARILGTGQNSLYRKAGVTLQEASTSGTGGTFQLPDLGSKYITTSSASGQYNDLTVTNPTTNPVVDRAGVTVQLSAGGTSVIFGYGGEFRHPGVSSLTFGGEWRAVSPPTRTNTATLAISDFLAHGHIASYTIGGRVNVRNDGLLQVAYRGARFSGGYCCNSSGTPCPSNGNAGVEFVSIDADEEGIVSSHNHNVPTPTVDDTPVGSIPATTGLSAASLQTTVTVNTRNTFKMDDIAPKFIICEYLIKF